MKRTGTESAQLLTKVEAHFPAGSRLLITRLDDLNLEIQLLDVNQPDSGTPAGGGAKAFGERPAEAHVAKLKPVSRERYEEILLGSHAPLKVSNGFQHILDRVLRVVGLRPHRKLDGMHFDQPAAAVPSFNPGPAIGFLTHADFVIWVAIMCLLTWRLINDVETDPTLAWMMLCSGLANVLQRLLGGSARETPQQGGTR